MARLTKPKKKQVLAGFFITYALWVLGIFASGRILFVEEIEFYKAPPILCVVFSAAFLLYNVIAAYKCKKTGSQYYFAGMITAVILPIAAWLVASLIMALCNLIGSLGAGEAVLVPITIVCGVFSAISFPLSSVEFGWAMLDIGEEWPHWAFIAVMAITIVLPVLVYKVTKKVN